MLPYDALSHLWVGAPLSGGAPLSLSHLGRSFNSHRGSNVESISIGAGGWEPELPPVEEVGLGAERVATGSGSS